MVSIVVPVYNVEQYLEPCVESILNSTYRDIEVVLVNDGSTDRSVELCDQLSKQDFRVKVIHKANGGVSDARNVGMKASTGDEIMFVDGDDMIHPQMIELLKTTLDSADFDFSMAQGIRIADDDTNGIRRFLGRKIQEPKRIILSQFDYMNRLVSGGEERFWSLSVCAKLFKKAVIKDVLFDTSINNTEDLEWSTRLSIKMNRAITIDEQLYLYIHRRGSAMHGGMNLSYIKGIYVYKKVVDYLPDQFKSRALKQLYTYMLLIRRYSIKSPYHQEAKNICDEIYKDTINDFMQSDNNWLSKWRSILGYRFPGLYNFITRVLELIVVRYYRLRGRKW